MFILKLLLFSLLFVPGNELWKRIETGQGVSFLFPNNAQTFKRNINEIEAHIYQTKDLTCVFGVVCSDFSAAGLEINPENVQQLYEQLKKGSLDLPTAILKDEKTIPYEGMLIKEIEYSLIKDNYEMTYFKRFIFRDNKVYQVSVGGRTRHRNYIERGRELFFNSFQFKEPVPAKK